MTTAKKRNRNNKLKNGIEKTDITEKEIENWTKKGQGMHEISWRMDDW
jgi:hypothetical protein